MNKKEAKGKLKLLSKKSFLISLRIIDIHKKRGIQLDITQLFNLLKKEYPITRQGLSKELNKAKSFGWLRLDTKKDINFKQFEKEKKARHRWIILPIELSELYKKDFDLSKEFIFKETKNKAEEKLKYYLSLNWKKGRKSKKEKEEINWGNWYKNRTVACPRYNSWRFDHLQYAGTCGDGRSEFY